MRKGETDDRRVLAFAKRFEETFVGQGMIDRDTIETLDLAWDLLRPMPAGLLKRIPDQVVEEHYKSA
jgi:V/A-type H+-transporting ATPase subunit B